MKRAITGWKRIAACSLLVVVFLLTAGQSITRYVINWAGITNKPWFDLGSFTGNLDGQWFYASAVTVTSGSPNITVTGAGFCNGGSVPCAPGQTTSVGKVIFANRNGTNQGPSSTDATALAPTTVLSVTDSTHIVANANATASCLATQSCVFFIGSNFTTQLQAADAAYQALTTCKYILWPAGWAYTTQPVFNTANTSCGYVPQAVFPTVLVPSLAVKGGAPSQSGIVFHPATFNFAGCPAAGCFFSPLGGYANLKNLSIYCGWSNAPSGGHSNTLVNMGTNSNMDNVVLAGCDANDGTTTGLRTDSFTNITNSYILGFGATGCYLSGQPLNVTNTYCGNSSNNNAIITGSNSVINTTNVTFGQTMGSNATINVIMSGNSVWNSKNDFIYGNGTASQTLIFDQASAASILNIDGIQADNSTASNTNGLFLNTAGTTAYVKNSLFGGNGTGFGVNPNTGNVFDMGGNKTNGVGFNKNARYFKPAPEGNCSSSAAPAVCGSSGAGSVTVAAAATTVTVNTTAVTAQSQILIQEDDTLGTKLGVTCNTTLTARTYEITARTAGTSFQITSSAAPVTNPACLSYTIIN